MKIGIIGLGMVGEPIRRWFEEVLGYKRGRTLFCYDTDPKKSYSDDINKADIIFVAVPTPSNPNGSCNISIVESALNSIQDGKIVVIKSTITPGTVERLQKKHQKKRLIFCPEFLTEAQAWIDFISPDRQIVAPTSKSISDAYEVLSLLPKRHFIRPWSSDYVKKSINASEAELSKYASNIFGYMKVIFGNILADFCEALSLQFKQEGIPAKVDYENIRDAISADLRIGQAWLNVNHGNYCGAGGYCLAPNERLFVFNDHKFKISYAKDLNKKAVSILGWKNGQVIKDKITIIGKRIVNLLIKFSLKKGRSITVTPDHLVVVSDKYGNLNEKCAKDVTKDDHIPVILDSLKFKKSSKPIVLNLYKHIDYKKERVLVGKVPQKFADKLKSYLTPNELREFRRARWHAIPIRACLDAKINIDNLRIKTGTSGTWVPATINLDEDFARFIGYFLAEGCITDNRVLICFSVHENDLIQDVKTILDKLEIKYSTKVHYWKGKKSSFTFKISSKVLAAYFSELCGHNCYNKQIPSFIFEAPQKIKDNFLMGALRGDGSIENSNQGDYYTVSFATVSQILAEGVDLLLREKGILASIKKIHTAKTKVDAWSLNISEIENVKLLLPFFTNRQREKVSQSYLTRTRSIASPAYKKVRNLAILPIRDIQRVKTKAPVYSLDTANHLYVASWGILTHNCFPKDMDAFIAFGDDLVKSLEKAPQKLGLDPGLIKCLKKGLAVFRAVRGYNEEVLKWQGLTIEDVKKHDKEVVVNKRKPIRTHFKKK